MNECLPLLRKSNEMMQCLLKRKSIQDVLRAQSGFFLAESGAEMMAIFIRQSESEYARFVFEKHHKLSSLIERHHFQLNGNAVAEAFLSVLGGLSAHKPYKRIDRLCPLLKGIVADRSCRTLADLSAFREALLFPVSLPGGGLIGVIGYYFTAESSEAKPPQLKELSETLQSVITPLYDEETSSFYTRYAHVDEAMSKLTTKERDIVRKVLRGENYSAVARTMGISINTLKTHMKNIFSKYGVRSKMELQNKILNG